MAKKKAPSKHSREARRATSPSIDTDRSLKELRPPSASATPTRPSVLAAHHSAGIQKPKPKAPRQMSAKARKRHLRGVEMAEAVVERTSKKVAQSEGRGRNVRDRRKAWAEVNRNVEDGHQTGGQDGERGDEQDAHGRARRSATDEELSDAEDFDPHTVISPDPGAGHAMDGAPHGGDGDEDGDVIL